MKRARLERGARNRRAWSRDRRRLCRQSRGTKDASRRNGARQRLGGGSAGAAAGIGAHAAWRQSLPSSIARRDRRGVSEWRSQTAAPRVCVSHLSVASMFTLSLPCANPLNTFDCVHAYALFCKSNSLFRPYSFGSTSMCPPHTIGDCNPGPI